MTTPPAVPAPTPEEEPTPTPEGPDIRWPRQIDIDRIINLDPDKLAFITQLMLDNGYSHPKPINDQYFGCIWPATSYLTALLVCEYGDKYSVIDRWDYHDPYAAVAALDQWEGIGEPEGWFRHPFSHRRRSEGPKDYDADGRQVPRGEIYIRR